MKTQKRQEPDIAKDAQGLCRGIVLQKQGAAAEQTPLCKFLAYIRFGQ